MPEQKYDVAFQFKLILKQCKNITLAQEEYGNLFPCLSMLPYLYKITFAFSINLQTT